MSAASDSVETEEVDSSRRAREGRWKNSLEKSFF